MVERNARVTPANENENENSESFWSEPATPARSREVFSSELSGPLRDSGIAPLFISDLDGSEPGRSEFIRGAEAVGLNTEAKPLRPQQFVIADVINAGNAVNGVCVPRRASKTTSVLAVALGRCFERPGYQVAFTAQSGVKARDRFMKDVLAPLERQFPDDDARPFKLNRSRGGEHVRFDNGSLFAVLPPIPDSFRGDAWDMVIADEAQEYTPELSADLLGAILPTFDTRPGAQLIVLGTAGEHRSGLLWNTLQQGREGREDVGICEYAAPDDTRVWDPDSGLSDVTGTTADPDVWKLAHPGIGTLTTLKAVHRNFDALGPVQFAREYLGVWPQGAGSQFLNAALWERGAQTGLLPTPPERFALAVQAQHEGQSATIVAAWRDDEGHACVLVLDHRKGTVWAAGESARLALKYRTPLVFDGAHSSTKLISEAVSRATSRPQMQPQVSSAIPVAAANFVRELETGNLWHWNQPALNDAVPLVIRRKWGQDGKRWALGRAGGEGDISAIEAAALALYAYDSQPIRMPMRIIA
jgi:hypothetical protein